MRSPLAQMAYTRDVQVEYICWLPDLGVDLHMQIPTT